MSGNHDHVIVFSVSLHDPDYASVYLRCVRSLPQERCPVASAATLGEDVCEFANDHDLTVGEYPVTASISSSGDVALALRA